MASDSDRANQSMMTPEDLSNIKGMITAYRMLAGVASTSKERMKMYASHLFLIIDKMKKQCTNSNSDI